MPTVAAGFRRRFCAGERLIGAFVKTAAAPVVEILAGLGYDFVVVDEEHGPLDRAAVDLLLLAARAGGVAGIVRVAEPSGARILSALDCGAAGVMVPHVRSADIAREIAAACRYRGGTRGFTAGSRAGGYGERGLAEHVARADAEVSAIAIVEDADALDHVDAIAAVDGIHGLFVGRADLAVSLGAEGPDAPQVVAAVARIAAAARAAGKPACVIAADGAQAAAFAALGVTSFIAATDQDLLRQAAAAALATLSRPA